MGRLAVARHADEPGRLRACEPAPRDLLAHRFGPGVVGDEEHVAAEQLVRVAHQPLPHAVGEEGDARDRAHRDHQRER
ncbi:MAG: hypothetical protein M5U08_14800 [Burkholderiales bacterium]|nr:hypothetical protein [Burkholderiales bacterium]